MTRIETKGEGELLHKCFPWALNRSLFLGMRSLKWMRIF